MLPQLEWRYCMKKRQFYRWFAASWLSGGLMGCGGGSGQPTSVTPAPSELVLQAQAVAFGKEADQAALSDLAQTPSLADFSKVAAGAGAPAGWSFTLGAEFAGAGGTLAVVPRGVSLGNAAQITADLSCGASMVSPTLPVGCGRYVGMIRALAPMVSVPGAARAAMLVSVRASNALLDSTLQIKDEGDQTLQFRMPTRSLESNAGAAWSRILVPIDASASFWGGSQDGKLHGSLKEVSVLAGNQTVSIPQADLLISDLAVQSSQPAAYYLQYGAPVLNAGVISQWAGRLAVATRSFTPKSLLHAKSIGVATLRLDMVWSDVEKSGQFDFSYYDSVLKQLAAQGMSALFILDYGHPAHGGSSPLSMADRAAFANFARQAALFAKGRNVVGLEIWNEPDNTNFWDQGNPGTYGQLLASAAAAITTADPSRKVLNGGVSWVNLPYMLQLVRTGQLAGCHAFAVHPYRTGAPESFGADKAAIVEILKTAGLERLPIWVTEWGYSSAEFIDSRIYGDGHDARARRRQGLLVLRSVLTQLAMNIPLMTIFELADTGLDPTIGLQNYGLLDRSENPKPAWRALKTLADGVSNKAYQGMLANLPAGAHALRWENTTDVFYAVWVDVGQADLNLVVPPFASVEDAFGVALATSPTASAAGQQLHLTEPQGPVFIRVPVLSSPG
jgi:hypothetical protein